MRKTAVMALRARYGLLLALAVGFTIGCPVDVSAQGHAYVGGDEIYQRFGLSKTTIAPWEDGMRTDGGKGNFEWWYFDAKLTDGSALVVVFYTKNILDVTQGLAPFISFKLTNPNGDTIAERVLEVSAAKFSASKEGCDVRIGKNRFVGNLSRYSLHLDFDDIHGDIALKGTTPAWRPGTGYSLFKDDHGESFFAWLPAVPSGSTSGTLQVAGKTWSVAGSGYHDHNWGNASMLMLMHDWYWGRAQVGPYTVITSYITASTYYGGESGSTFFLAKGGKVVAEDGKAVTCRLDGIYWDEKTGKPVANSITYEYDDGASHYRVIYRRKRDIENTKFIDRATTEQQRAMARLIGFDGAYLRFTGTATVERLEKGTVVESVSNDDAVWELMYLGHAPQK
jgi:predicted secreted hydrolase